LADDLERSFGLLAASGWTHDAILDLSWDQIAWYAEQVTNARLELVNLVAVPVVSSNGVRKWKGYELPRDLRRKERQKRGERHDGTVAPPTVRDAEKLRELSAMGFDVVEPTVTPSAPDPSHGTGGE
jgi:hypothetical protein